ncbi:MAG TPA: hypothetical protein VFT80_04175 [Actinomycetota bacterium]|nr:hypothetical protein [Actinomycetota bacterium]
MSGTWVRKVLAGIGLAVLLGASTPVAVSAAGGCVSRPEFRRVEIGMRKAHVHRIFDTRGEVIHEGPHREERAYDICRRYRGVVVFVTYRNDRVDEKSWILGE